MQFNSFPKGLVFRQALRAFLLAAGLAVLFSAISAYRDLQNHREALDSMTAQVISAVEHTAVQAAYLLDRPMAHELATGLMAYEATTRVTLKDDFGEVLVDLRRPDSGENRKWFVELLFGENRVVHSELRVTAPEEVRVGQLEVEISPHKQAFTFARNALTTLALLTGGVFILVALVFFVLQRFVVSPLLAYVESLRAIDPNVPMSVRLAVPADHRDDELGDLGRAVNALLDTIEDKFAEIERMASELQDYAGRLENAQRIARIGHFDLNLKTGSIERSRELFRIWQRPAEELGQDPVTYQAFVHPDDREFVRTTFEHARDGHGYSIDYRIYLPDGTLRHVHEETEVSFDAGNRPFRIAGTIQDITDRLEMQQSLTFALEQARLANRAKTQFLATMSHELRTPLNAVIGFAEMIESEALGPIGVPKYAEYVSAIRSAGQHLLSLINDVLDISKIEAGEFVLEREQLELPPLIRECLHLLDSSVKAKGLTARVEIAEGLPLVMADERAIKQILLNLIDNAIKHTPTGGSVSVKAAYCPEGLSVRVIDTGVGIAPEDLERVKQPFVSGGAGRDAFHSENGGGTGLGLAIADALAKLHDGTLTIESTLGQGTTVSLKLSKRTFVKEFVAADG